MELDKNNMRKIMMLIIFTILLIMASIHIDVILQGIGTIVNIMRPFILGAAIAFVINVPMKAIERELLKHTKVGPKLGRIISYVTAVCFISLAIVLVFWVVIPQLSETIVKLGQDAMEFWPTAQAWIVEFFRETPEIQEWVYSIEFDIHRIIDPILNFVKVGAGSILGSTVNVAKVIIEYATNLIIGFVFSVYVLLQKDTLRIQIKKVLYAFLKKERVDKFIEVATLTQNTFSGFISGQGLEAVILGTIFVVVLGIFGFPYALLIGVLIAFTALVPIIGAFIGCIVGAFLILLENPTQALLFIVIFLVIQQLEEHLIYPHVVGNSVGLPSIWVLVAITVGGSLMGVLGMLIFIPLLSVVYTLFRGCVYKRLKKRKIQNVS